MRADDLTVIETMRAQIRATPLPARSRWSSRRRSTLVCAGVITLAVTVVAALFIARTPGAPPAYAATLHPDRTVSITLREMQAIPALNRRLVALHTGIRVVPVRRDCVAPVHIADPDGRVVPGSAKTLRVSTYQLPGGRPLIIGSSLLHVNTVPGDTIVLAASRTGTEQFLIAPLVIGPAPPCVGLASTSEPTKP